MAMKLESKTKLIFKILLQTSLELRKKNFMVVKHQSYYLLYVFYVQASKLYHF